MAGRPCRGIVRVIAVDRIMSSARARNQFTGVYTSGGGAEFNIDLPMPQCAGAVAGLDDLWGGAEPNGGEARFYVRKGRSRGVT